MCQKSSRNGKVGVSMESQDPTEISRQSTEFLPGTPVIYGMHGKCQILGTEFRTLGEQKIKFYKLEIKKANAGRSTRTDTSIWVPVDSAKNLGLRPPMNAEEASEAIKILCNREYYFKPEDSWNSLLPKLESSIKKEGGLGLAKVFSFLYVLKKKQVVPSSDVQKLFETVQRLLFKELSDATGESSRVLEEKVARGMRSKLIPDT